MRWFVCMGLALSGLIVMIGASEAFGKPHRFQVPAMSSAGFVDIEGFSYLIDPSWALGPEEVLAFEPDDPRWMWTEGTLNLGYTDAALWVVIPLESTVSNRESRILELAYPNLDRVDVWVLQGDRIVSAFETGDTRLFDTRPIHHRNFLIPLEEAKSSERGETKVLARIGTTSSLQVPVRLWYRAAFERAEQSNRLVHGMFFGVMLVMAIYNFFIFISIRESAYLHYVAFVTSAGIYQAFHHGFTFQHLWPESLWWHGKSGAIAICLTIAFAAWFTRSLLELPQRLPRAARLLEILGALAGGLALTAFVLSYSWIARGAALLAIPTALTILASGIWLWRKGYMPARTFVLAWVAFTGGAIAFAGNKLGLLPHNAITENALQLGSTIEVMLLSFSLGERINQERRERIEHQAFMLSEQESLTRAYERFVPERFLALLGKKSIRDVSLGDHVEMSMSILFADIRGFTSLSESMTPRENFEILNGYLERMEPIIEEHGGFVDKYIGDCIMALFDRAPDDAVAAGIGLQQTLYQLNEEGILHSSKTFDIGVGINLGEMMLGTIGAKGRLEGTVISDAVNTAARIESLTKTYGAGLIISQSTRRNLINPGRFTIRVLDRVRVKGRHEPVIIYEVLDALPREVKRRRAAYMDTYEAAVKRFWARDFEGALRRFGECASLDPDDPVVQLFLRRARWFARQGAAPEWSGAFDAESIFGDGEAT